MAPPAFLPAGPRCNCLIVFGKPCPFKLNLTLLVGGLVEVKAAHGLRTREDTAPMRCAAGINAPPQMQAPPPASAAPEDVRSGCKGRRAEEVELARSAGVKPRTPRLANR